MAEFIVRNFFTFHTLSVSRLTSPHPPYSGHITDTYNEAASQPARDCCQWVSDDGDAVVMETVQYTAAAVDGE